MNISEILVKAIENMGYEADIYSGRSMYGKRCIAVNVENSGMFLVDLMAEVFDKIEGGSRERFVDALRNVKTDSMGHDEVVYWPRLEFPEEVETDSDEEDEWYSKHIARNPQNHENDG